MDLIAVRYNTLYDNVPFFAAVLAMKSIAISRQRPDVAAPSRRPASTSASTCCCGSTAAGWRSTSPSTWRS